MAIRLHRRRNLPLSFALMFVLVRAITYAVVFVALVFIYLPARLLSWSGIIGPAVMGQRQILGMVIATGAAALAFWCVLIFVVAGKGTPAPFDPPRHLVVRGPYRFVRNPMYIAATVALCGLALFYGSWLMLVYAGLFLFATNLFVVWYEEPSLRRDFGENYNAYCRRVGRWWIRGHRKRKSG